MEHTKPFFEMNQTKAETLSGVITTINSEIEHLDGLEKRFVLMDPHITEEERKEKLKKLENKKEKWSLYHDAFGSIQYRGHEMNLKYLMKTKSEWKNEWDVPNALFNEAINETKNVFDQILKFAHGHAKKEYEKRKALVEEIESFINQ